MAAVLPAPQRGLPWFQRLCLGLLLLWLLLPLVPPLVWSFAKGWYYPQLLPESWSLDAWRYVLAPHSQVLASFASSLLCSGTVAFLAALIGVPAGRALGMCSFRGRGWFEMLVIAPTIVPGLAVALGLHIIFIRLGLANSLAGVIIVHLIPTLPYMILVMAGVFANYDPRYEEQARSLGANSWEVWRHVILPAVYPGIIVGALFAFIVSWSQYVMTLLIGGGKVVSVPLLLFNFASAGRNDIAGAICMLYIIPGALIVLASARHLKGVGVMSNLSNP